MKRITVPEEGIETLFGAYDENLKRLESLFSVRIRTQGNDLLIDLMGSTDSVTVTGWFGGNARAQVASIVDTADGLRIDAQVSQLVSAMATYSTSNPGFDPTTATQVPNDPNLQAAVAA